MADRVERFRDFLTERNRGRKWSDEQLHLALSLADMAAAQRQGSDQSPGKMMIDERTWLRVWHDEDVLSNKYKSYGIIVGPPAAGAVAQRESVPLGGKVAGSSPARASAGVLRSALTKAAGTCKPGQTAEATGCTPASGDGGGKAPPSGKPAAERSAGKAVVDAFGKAAAKYEDAKATAKRFGGAGFAKLPPKAQKALTKLWGWTKFVEHKVMTGFTKAKELAKLAAKERGLSDEQAEKIAKVLGTVDVIAAWTVNMPATMAVTGSVTAAKMASWVPVASLAYLAYSTARNPLATVRAAKRLIKQPKHGTKSRSSTHKGKKVMDKKKLAEALAARVESLGKNWDWYLALLHAALDETGGDVVKSLAAADAALKKQPAPPDESDLSEEDVAQFNLGAK